VNVKNALRQYGIFDDSGRLVIPVIHESDSDPLYKSCAAVSGKLCDRFLQAVDFSRLTKEARLPDELTAFVIAYHEFIWEMMTFLEQERIISVPQAFRSPERSGSANFHKLLFIVRY